MNVPFLDLVSQNAHIKGELLVAWEAIVDSARFVAGYHVARFEESFAAAHAVEHCVAVANGTVALELPLRAMGVGPGDDVAVPANTFIATAEAVSNVGARPVLVDVDPHTLNIDPHLLADVASRAEVVGTMAVHLYGQPCDIDAITSVADRTNTWFVEDAAQAHLARHRDRPIGGLGSAGGFSFYPGKNLGAPGEGGAILTNDAGLAADLRALRDHGQTEKYRSRLVGTNARMLELVAAALELKLRLLPEWTAARQSAAARYLDNLEGVAGLQLPHVEPWAEPVWHLFVIHCERRDAVRQRLAERGVQTGLHYPIPIHLQAAYEALGHQRGDFPVAESSADRLLSLPMHEGITNAELDYVSEHLIDAVSQSQ